ncbi:Sensory box histidine kinase/response regulator protein (fragment) [Desulfamplus magnetovallimortis]|uniref:histidine kinase n=1 Tax=Desulfamplus magnetovallimortis TaxID=1246637 RepID=A0A1W1HEA3_9BACT
MPKKIQRKLKKAHYELQKSEEKFRLAFLTSPDAININRLEDGIYLDINEGFTNLMGYTREETVGRSSIELQIWNNTEDRAILRKELEEKGFVENLEAKFRAKNGEIKIGLMSARILNLNDENIILSITRDVTEREMAKKALERLLTAIEHSAETIVITDINGNIEYVNPVFEKLTGYSREEAMGQNPKILKSGQHDRIFYRDMWQTILSGKTWQGRIINRKKDGTLFTEEATISPVFENNGAISNFVAVKRDITEELRMAEQYQQSQKMESIGTLAGGIAHDFNNILFPIMGHTEMLMDDIPQENPLRESLDQIFSASIRARDLVKQILTFSRQESSEAKLIKIQHIAKEALKLIRSSIPATIEIKHNINSDCRAVKADPTQIHQIIMNLTTNAFHAMEETGGEMTVTLSEVQLHGFKSDTPHLQNDFKSNSPDLLHDFKTDTPEILHGFNINAPALPPGQYVCLTVSDTGEGIPEEIITKIFDPFFTTKKEGKGTGMGLSVVHGIVKNAGGDIQVVSKPGKGTVFSIYLPIAENFSDTKIENSKKTLRYGTEKILLLDDEESIIKMEKPILEKMGYQVTSHTSVFEALDDFRSDSKKFDLIITDMAMPKLSGKQLAIEMLKIRPDIPILICTGFSDNISEDDALSIGIKAFLMKPFSMNELSEKIRDILDRSDILDS